MRLNRKKRAHLLAVVAGRECRELVKTEDGRGRRCGAPATVEFWAGWVCEACSGWRAMGVANG